MAARKDAPILPPRQGISAWRDSELLRTTGVLGRAAALFAAKVSLAQVLRQKCLRFPHGAVDSLVLALAFLGFVIAAEIKLDSPSAVAACDDLPDFGSHRDSPWLAKRDTQLAHTRS